MKALAANVLILPYGGDIEVRASPTSRFPNMAAYYGRNLNGPRIYSVGSHAANHAPYISPIWILLAVIASKDNGPIITFAPTGDTRDN